MKKTSLNRAFTLVELMVACGCLTVFGAIIYVLSLTGMNLFVRSYAMNQSNDMARLTVDRLARDVYQALEAPSLVDDAGAKVSISSTPVSAAGIKFRKFIGGPFKIPNALAAGATSIQLNLQASDPMPRVGQFLIIPASTLNIVPQDVYLRITAVSPAAPATSTTPTVTFASTAGSFMTPTASTGNLAAANSVGYLAQEIAYIVVTPSGGVPELRFYPRAMSVATDGVGTFNNKVSFALITQNLIGSTTPFSTALGDRSLSVLLKTQDDTFTNRIKSTFTKSLTIGATGAPHKIPYRTLGL